MTINNTNQNFSINIDAEKFNTFQKTIYDLNNILKSVLYSLGDTDRRCFTKMTQDKVYFVQKTIRYSKSNPEFVSAYIDKAKMEEHMNTIEQLNLMHKPLSQLIQQIEDTIFSLGGQAYSDALDYYQTVRIGLRKKVPGAQTIYNDLKQHFVIKSSNSAKE